MTNVDNIFSVLELIENLRDIFRQTAPLHKFDSQQTNKIRDDIQQAKKLLNEIETCLVETCLVETCLVEESI